jgi:peptide/nickel transport system permease protein
MTSLTLLLIFVLVGLDSLHYRERLAPAGARPPRRSRSYPLSPQRLDALAEPLRTRVEKTYSAPLAWQLFARRPWRARMAPAPGVPAPQVRRRGAAVSGGRPGGDIVGRIAMGLAAAAGVWLVLAGAVVGWWRVRGGCPWRGLAGDVAWQGRAGLAGDAAHAGRCVLLVGPVTALATEYHVFGTDKVGQDVLFLTLKSIRTALVIGPDDLVTLPLAVALGIVRATWAAGWMT